MRKGSGGLADEINFEDFLTIMSYFQPIDTTMDEEQVQLCRKEKLRCACPQAPGGLAGIPGWPVAQLLPRAYPQLLAFLYPMRGSPAGACQHGVVSLWTVCVRAAGGLASHCPQGRAGNAAMEWQGPGVPSGVVVDKHLNLCEP